MVSLLSVLFSFMLSSSSSNVIISLIGSCSIISQSLSLSSLSLVCISFTLTMFATVPEDDANIRLVDVFKISFLVAVNGAAVCYNKIKKI